MNCYWIIILSFHTLSSSMQRNYLNHLEISSFVPCLSWVCIKGNFYSWLVMMLRLNNTFVHCFRSSPSTQKIEWQCEGGEKRVINIPWSNQSKCVFQISSMFPSTKTYCSHASRNGTTTACIQTREEIRRLIPFFLLFILVWLCLCLCSTNSFFQVDVKLCYKCDKGLGAFRDKQHFNASFSFLALNPDSNLTA